ncbi:hypothetical protein FRC12_004431 [Ceratobasidium sp. 428]|nr:hypothetical protein FRC12_004431 [Ceratobasidium sp. 428]
MTAEMGSMSYQSRMHAFEEILDSSSALRVVDIPQLRSLALHGIPEYPTWMRSRIWRLLLGALPPEKDKWEDTARKSRTRYYDVAAQLLDPIQTSPPPEYPLNARDKLLDTIAKDVDRTQPRIPFFRRPIHPLQSWPTLKSTTPSSGPSNESNDAQLKSDVADALFDRLMLVQRVVRFGTSAPPPLPHTPEIRVVDELPAEGEGKDPKSNEGGDAVQDKPTEEGGSSKADAKSESDTDSDDQPLAFKAGGRSSLGVTPNTLSPNLSPRMTPSQSHVTLPTLQLNNRSHSPDAPLETKTHAHILLRILFVYSLLHPHHPYTQGLNELLAPLYYTVFEGRTAGLRSYTLGVHREELVGEAAVRAGEAASPARSRTKNEEDDPARHIEADTFWLFVELMGELGSVVSDPGDWSLPPVSSGSGEGVRGVMVRLSERLRWADARLWEDMVKKSLDPRLPYFSYRWIACLLAQDLPLTALLPVWDTLLAQAPSTPETNAKIEWLLDICVGLLVGVRERLIRAGNRRGGVGLWGEEDEEEDVPLSMIQNKPNSPIGPNGSGASGMNEGFVQGMLLLQRYPLEDVGLGWVLNKAFELGAKRAAGFGIQDSDRGSGAGWGEGAWGVAAAMRDRVAGWRQAHPEGAAFATPVPEVLVSPPAPNAAPSIAMVGGKLRQYTETFKQSDAAASLSKASTNWSLAVMSAWNRSGGSGQTSPSSPGEQVGSPVPAPPPKDGRTHGHGHGRSDSWAGWGATAVAAAKLRAAALAKRVPDPVPEEEPKPRPEEPQWDAKRQTGDRSQSLSPTALARVMASTQQEIAAHQQRSTTHPGTSPSTPRSAREPESDYEPPPRPAFFKPPRESWMPVPKPAETHDEDPSSMLTPGGVPAPAPSPSPNSQRYTMTLPGWSAVPPSSSPAQSPATKKTGPKPLLLGKTRSPATNAAARFRDSRQSSISSSTGSHREWELMNALSPRSDTGSVVGATARPDSGSFARSRRSMGTSSVPTSAPGSVVQSEDEAVVVGLGLIPGGSSDNGSPPLIIPSASERFTSIDMKRTSSPLSASASGGVVSLSTGGSTDSSRGWQLADGPITTEPAPVRKWELTDGPTPASVEVSEPKSKAETLPTDLKHTNSTATVRKFELTDGPAPSRATTAPLKATEAPPPESPVVAPPAPRKWELSDNPVPRIDSNVSQSMAADSDAADSPINSSGGAKIWPKRISSSRPTNLRVKTRPTSSASTISEAKTPAADALRTPLVEKESAVTPTSGTNLAYMRTPSPRTREASLPQVEEKTPRRKKAGQPAPAQNRRSRVARGAARTPEVMSEEDGMKADAEDGEYEDLLSAYETETDDVSQGAGHAR